MQERIQNVFRKVFRRDDLVITDASSASDIPMWDSLTHLELIAAIEEEFNVKFSFREVMEFNSVGDLRNCILSRKSDQHGI
jgi:acyl carrier protein